MLKKSKHKMPQRVFDDTDRKLIAFLRKDGRAPISKLSDALSLSRGTVQARLDRLLESGALLGFTIRVREDYDAQAVKAIMLIQVAGKSTLQVIRRLRGLPELQKIYTTNGGWDMVVEICAVDLADFDRVLREVRETEGVANSETSILLSEV